MTKKLIIANWKMNPQTSREAKILFEEVGRFSMKVKKSKVVACPPFVWLYPLNAVNDFSNTTLGAQDCFWESKGSYTGEISIPMLKNLGVKYVIVGHSERRHHFVSTNEMINKKIKSALKANIKTIFCVGEKERDEDAEYLKFVKKEITEGLNKIPRTLLKNLIIAYEPIWAISSSKNALPDTPENLLEMSIYIRRVLFFKFGRKVSKETPILYGGSVSAVNARDFLEKGNVQGLLVGKASLKKESFEGLLKSIE